ncbi:unnamed protein product [Gordionus sp. m RMFG-2023]|uniref:cytochrome c oxidase subunit 5A, mitochondrial-like n=1 Tax=Gordionus sp. m RMFG-2023 TaxID=3053472 RepID=UPI0030E3FD86
MLRSLFQKSILLPCLIKGQNSFVKPRKFFISKYSTHVLTDEEFDEKYISYFSKPNIDNWEIRHGINDIIHSDVIPEPKVLIAILKACRRLNDYALTTRILEAVKYKCGRKVDEIYLYLIQEIRPTIDELGISTPEELGFDKPEFLVEEPQYQ